jgi:hypothetical protein
MAAHWQKKGSTSIPFPVDWGHQHWHIRNHHVPCLFEQIKKLFIHEEKRKSSFEKTSRYVFLGRNTPPTPPPPPSQKKNKQKEISNQSTNILEIIMGSPRVAPHPLFKKKKKPKILAIN